MSKDKITTKDCVTVDQLIHELKNLRDAGFGNSIVVLQSDSEGNGYSPYDDCGHANYLPETNWSGTLVQLELTPQLSKLGYCDEDIYQGTDSVSCVVLTPRN